MWPRQSSFPILSTKLIPPSQRTALVNRQRLTARIGQIVDHRLFIISAPAGYGKTTVLAQAFALLAGQERNVGWLSLERDDNDLARFLSYLIEAGRRARVSFGAATSTLLSARAELPANTLKTSLLNELAAVESDVFLFLDDYHLIQDEEILDFMSAMLLAPLPRIHLLIGTRAQNCLPVGRLRALGAVQELEAQQLMFSSPEISEFFSQVGHTGLDDSHISLLRDATEGWIASLQMISIALRTVPQVDLLVQSLTGAHQSISSFLSEEVFRRQPPEIQEFLLGTSILKRFNCGLCNAVLRRQDSRELLDRLESANLFIFSLGSDRNWYRYHHLFSEFLRKIFTDSRPALMKEYHGRACAWLAANDFTTEAIDHAFSSGDLENAAELLDEASATLFATGQTSTLQMYSARIPAELLLRMPRLQLELAWNYEIQWRFEAARKVLANVRSAIAGRQGDMPNPLRRIQFDRLQNKLAHRELMLAMFTDDYETGLDLCQKWQRSVDSDDLFMVASVGTSMMMCNRERYECAGTAQTVETLRKQFVDASALYGAIFHDSAAGQTFFMRGELDLACQVYERALASAEALHGVGSNLASMPAMMLAEAWYEGGLVNKAGSLLERYRSVSAEFGFVDNAIARFVTGARVARLAGDEARAEASLEAGFYVAAKYGFRRLHAAVLAEKIRFLLNDGKVKEAVRCIQSTENREWCRSICPGSKATTTDEVFATTYARVHSETGQIGESLASVRKWFIYARDRHCYRSVVRLGVLLAKLYFRAGDRLAAKRYLLETLKFAEPGRFIRSFVDEGAAIAHLLRDLLPHPGDSMSCSQEFVHAVVSHFPDSAPAARAAATTSADRNGTPLQPLSARELEILRLTAENLENKEIAYTLGLTESTVKWYWKRIFFKLHVHRRFHAVKVARQNGLVA